MMRSQQDDVCDLANILAPQWLMPGDPGDDGEDDEEDDDEDFEDEDEEIRA